MKKCIFITLFILLIIPLYAQEFYPDSAVVIGFTHYWGATGKFGGSRASVRDSQGWIHAVYCMRLFERGVRSGHWTNVCIII